MKGFIILSAKYFMVKKLFWQAAACQGRSALFLPNGYQVTRWSRGIKRRVFNPKYFKTSFIKAMSKYMMMEASIGQVCCGIVFQMILYCQREDPFEDHEVQGFRPNGLNRLQVFASSSLATND